MRIALDFDGTYTADPVLWHTFVVMAKSRGHEVKIVTARDEDERRNGVGYDDNSDVKAAAYEMGVDVIYCGFVQKQDCWGADIWIDDRPDMVIGKDQLVHMHGLLNCS